MKDVKLSSSLLLCCEITSLLVIRNMFKSLRYQTSPLNFIALIELVGNVVAYPECLNIYVTYVTANRSTNNNVVFFLFQI